MLFRNVEKFYGSIGIIADDPKVASDHRFIYRPFSTSTFFDRYADWGIYNEQGKLSLEGSYTRNERNILIGQSATTSVRPNDCEIIDTPCAYFGPLIPHYGHFILTTLARSWYVARAKAEGRKLVCHSDHAPSSYLRRRYVSDCFCALGLDVETIICPRVDTFFTDMVVPAPSFIEEKEAFEIFGQTTRAIGDRILGDASRKRNETPLYLSKSKLGPGSVHKIVNETEIENELQNHGVEVCYPEELHFADQLRLFATRSLVIGFNGSAFHTHTFVKNAASTICVSMENYVNSNQIMIDRLGKTNSRYVYVEDGLRDTPVNGYMTAKTVERPREFAHALLDLAGIRFKSTNRVQSTKGTSKAMFSDNCVADHAGESYRNTLLRLHEALSPKSYLEIGTLNGGTLALATAASISIDPKFQISSQVIGSKPICLFYQMPSDTFFERYNPKALLSRPIELSFLDGMHRCEYLLRDFINAERHADPEGVIALHDCLPVEIPMTDRTQNGTAAEMPHRNGWWTGDVWRTALLLKRRRPDLKMLCLDAGPTGIVLISGLDPYSTKLRNDYSAAVDEMMAMELADITVSGFLREMSVVSTATVQDHESLRKALHG